MQQNKKVEQPFNFDNEFEIFFKSCDKLNLNETDLNDLFRPIKAQLRYEYGIKLLKVFSLIIFLSCLFYYIPTLNWNLTAILRIFLIKLLPYFNWKPYFNSRCLITSLDFGTRQQNQIIKTADYKLYSDDCVVCENYDFVERVTDPSYTYLYERFLLRANPVVVLYSHPVWNSDNFTHHLLTLDKLLSSDPCEMQSNLIFSKYQTIGDLLEQSIRTEQKDSWFLHFQNCFEGVKHTRMIGGRPNYLSSHLEPPHSSWILISQNYPSKPKELNVNGLIVVMQLKGEIEIILSSKGICFDICGKHSIILFESDSLIFTTDLWTIQYYPTSSIKKSITFITETFQQF